MSGVALALVSAILFGASTPASKLLLGSLGPFQLAGLLYLGAALGMAFPLERERRRVAPSRLDARNLRRLAGAVVFGGVIGPVLLLFGLELSFLHQRVVNLRQLCPESALKASSLHFTGVDEHPGVMVEEGIGDCFASDE